MRTMAQRLVSPASVPQTHEAQQQQDERESAQLFFNSLDRLAEGDADLSREETATLLRYVGHAGALSGGMPLHAPWEEGVGMLPVRPYCLSIGSVGRTLMDS